MKRKHLILSLAVLFPALLSAQIPGQVLPQPGIPSAGGQAGQPPQLPPLGVTVLRAIANEGQGEIALPAQGQEKGAQGDKINQLTLEVFVNTPTPVPLKLIALDTARGSEVTFEEEVIHGRGRLSIYFRQPSTNYQVLLMQGSTLIWQMRSDNNQLSLGGVSADPFTTTFAPEAQANVAPPHIAQAPHYVPVKVKIGPQPIVSMPRPKQSGVSPLTTGVTPVPASPLVHGGPVGQVSDMGLHARVQTPRPGTFAKVPGPVATDPTGVQKSIPPALNTEKNMKGVSTAPTGTAASGPVINPGNDRPAVAIGPTQIMRPTTPPPHVAQPHQPAGNAPSQARPNNLNPVSTAPTPVNVTHGLNPVPQTPTASNVTHGLTSMPPTPPINVTHGLNSVPQTPPINVTHGLNPVPQTPTASNVTHGLTWVPPAPPINVTHGMNRVAQTPPSLSHSQRVPVAMLPSHPRGTSAAPFATQQLPKSEVVLPRKNFDYEIVGADKQEPVLPSPIPVRPPDPLPETVPDQPKTFDGKPWVWVPGYWQWDFTKKTYVWVGGIWHQPPTGHQWLPGKWTEVAGRGWVWTGGQWVSDGKTLVTTTKPEPKPAPLQDSRPAMTLMISSEVLAKHGGIVCEQIAQPVSGQAVERMELDYDPSRPDGGRLILRANGREVKTPPIMDWQLKPTAAFADDTDSEGRHRVGLVTLTGDVKDSTRLPSNLLVCNLHPAFENTRAGYLLSLFDYTLVNMEGALRLTDMASASRRNLGHEDRSRQASTSIRNILKKGRWENYLIYDRQPCGFEITDGQLRFHSQLHCFFWNAQQGAVVESTAIGEEFNRMPNLWRDLNPAAYDNAQTIACYAAFFRYIKASEPQSWQTFVEAMSRIKVEPFKTPVYYFGPRQSAEKTKHRLSRIDPPAKPERRRQQKQDEQCGASAKGQGQCRVQDNQTQ